MSWLVASVPCVASGLDARIVKRTELRRGKPLERGTKRLARGKPLRQIGRRARAQADEREAMRQTVLAETGGVCCVAKFVPGQCAGFVEVHEVIDRSVRPGVHLDSSLGISVCHFHHVWISADATRARDVGLSFFSYEVEMARERAAMLRRWA